MFPSCARKLFGLSAILLVASLSLPQVPSTVAQTQSSLPKDLVFIGTVTKLYPFSAPANARRRWAVRVLHQDAW